MKAAYEKEKDSYREYFTSKDGRSGKEEEVRTTPLFSLRVKHTVDGTYRTVSPDGGGENDQKGPECDSSPGSSSSSSSSSPEQSRQPVLKQYGLLGHHIGDNDGIGHQEPILLNINAPNSAFVCGSQGSGKSYTLMSMLQNCLLPGEHAGSVNTPVAGVVFHYDVNSTPTPAEAAALCSQGIKVNVFVSTSNERELSKAYKAIDKTGNLTVRPLQLRSSDLNVDRMNKLMALAEKDGPMPLYMEVVQRILRTMAIDDTFSYSRFKRELKTQKLTRDQTGPLNLRLELLESFMDPKDVPFSAGFQGTTSGPAKENVFKLEPGTLTIIDLSDPFVDPSTSCMLFDVCLGLIKEQRPDAGLVIALDEAHKFMNASTAAARFTDSLLTTIRVQRHCATRVYIATQEPTISERLLDLCSMTIVHRFTSPAWFSKLSGHLGGASQMVSTGEEGEGESMFESIVNLDVGESLVFCPSGFVVLEDATVGPKKLGAGVMKMKTRARKGDDAGRSKLADGGGDGMEGIFKRVENVKIE